MALAMVCALLASCGGETTSDNAETSASPNIGQNASDTETAETTSVPAISPDLPKVDYDGYEFVILKSDEYGHYRYSPEFYAEKEIGEPINDAVYKRNLMLSERFNFKIGVNEQAKGQLSNLFQTAVLANDDAYDLLVHEQRLSLLIAPLCATEISEIPYLDIDNDWWDGELIRQMSIEQMSYALTGNINIVDDRQVWCLLFNKRLAEDNNVGDLYSLVRDGEWTIDEMNRACSNVSYDLNGDSVMDYQDNWGMVSSGGAALALMEAFGGCFGSVDSDGNLEITIDSEKNINSLNKAWEFYSQSDKILDINKVSAVGDMGNWDVMRDVFRQGRSLFIGGVLSYVENFRDMEDEFGILPLPKYDANQDEYITVPHNQSTVLMVPRSASDLSRTGVILEAMASAAVSTITPAFYDVVLERKLTRDDESVEMLDIIFDSVVFDTVYAFNWGKIATTLEGILDDESNTIVSTIASIKSTVYADYENYVDSLN